LQLSCFLEYDKIVKNILKAILFILLLLFFISPKQNVFAIDSCYECRYTGMDNNLLQNGGIKYFQFSPCPDQYSRADGGQWGLCTSDKPVCSPTSGCMAQAVQSCTYPTCCYCQGGTYQKDGTCSDGSPTFQTCTLQPGWTCKQSNPGCVPPPLNGVCSLCQVGSTKNYTTSGVCDGGTLTPGRTCDTNETCDHVSGCANLNKECDPSKSDSCPTGFVCLPDSNNQKFICQKGTQQDQFNQINCLGDSCKTALGNVSTNPSGFIARVFGLILSISGGIALLMIIISGYKILSSQGNPEALKGAREQLTAAIVGLLFIIFALVILQIIGYNILHVPAFGK
jgi:hypothetical protein